jgi:hypothetical protein
MPSSSPAYTLSAPESTITSISSVSVVLWTPAVWTPNSTGSPGGFGSARKSCQPIPANASTPCGTPSATSRGAVPVNERLTATRSSSPALEGLPLSL